MKPIEAPAEYEAYKAELHRLWNCVEGSAEELKFIALAEAVVVWEQKEFAIPPRETENEEDTYDGEPD